MHLHHRRRSKNQEQTMAPAVMMSRSQADSAELLGRSQTSSHTRMAANSAHRNQAPQAPTACPSRGLQPPLELQDFPVASNRHAV